MVLIPSLQSTPLLPLDLYRERIEHSPWAFWGLANTIVPVTSACNGLVYEYAWQNANGVGRTEIRRALVDAQDLLADYLRYDVAPAYREDVVPWPRLNDAAWSRNQSIDQRGQYLSVILPRVNIREVGIQRTTLIGTPAVVYSDTTPLDGLNDTFTLTIATSVTDPDQLQVFVSAVNRFDGSSLSQRWRIAPVRVTISGGVATIVGKAWLAVRPVLYETQGAALDPSTAGNFQTTMDVARVYIDPNGITTDDSQATLLYEAIPCPWFCVPCTSLNISTDPAAVGAAIARVGIRNAQTGTVTPASAVYDATTTTWAAGGCCWTCQPEPDRVLVRYTEGMPLVDHQMAAASQEVIAMLATAMIAGPICACKEANKRIGYLQFDLARSSGAGGEAYGLISGEDLRNPFGTRRGQVLAWKRVSQQRSVRGFSY